jgi:hypothetical protein
MEWSVNEDLHEGWNDLIAVLRICAVELLGSVKIRYYYCSGTTRPIEAF